MPLQTTPAFHRRVHAALLSLLASLLLGNPLLFDAALLLFTLLMLEAAGSAPRVDLAADVSHGRVLRGDVVRLHIAGRVGGALGRIRVHAQLPAEAELRAGSNLRVAFALPWQRSLAWEVRFAALKRGEHEVGPVRLDFLSALGSFHREVDVSPARHLTVWPRQQAVRRMREIRTYGRLPQPDEAIARLGVRSHDFRDIRAYQRGDPVRWINWRATAKHLSRGNHEPLVNEYEVEGKRAVWVLVDAAPHSAVGTNVEDVLDHQVEAAVGITSYFLGRGCKVGVQAHPRLVFLPPDVGREQLQRTLRHLTMLAHAKAGSGSRLSEAVEKARRFLVSERPTCFVLTRPEADPRGTAEAVKRIRGLVGRRASVFLVAVNGSRLHAGDGPFEGFVAAANDARLANAGRAARSSGAVLVSWDPTRQRFGSVLGRVAAPGVRR